MKKIRQWGIYIIIIFCVCPLNVASQYTTKNTYPNTINKKKLRTTIGIEVGTYLAGLSFLSFIWYKDKQRVPFHYYDDSQGYLQMDKAGHAFGAYRESFSAYYALRRAGVSKKKSLIYGGPIGLIFQTPIEIFDGLYENWGFSWPDMIANTFGAVLFTGQEILFDEQVFLMKFSYSPSIYPQQHSGLGVSHIERFFIDYNGHTYWMSGNIQRLTGIENIPQWLNIAIGYSANGVIGEFKNPEYYKGKPFPFIPRYRQLLLSLDINFSKIHTNKIWVRKLLNTINLIKMPLPALEFNRIDGVKAHIIYF